MESWNRISIANDNHPYLTLSGIFRPTRRLELLRYLQIASTVTRTPHTTLQKQRGDREKPNTDSNTPPDNRMIVPTNLVKYGGIIALLIGTSAVTAKTSSSPSMITKPALVTPAHLPATANLVSLSEQHDISLARNVIEKTRGGEGDVSLSERLRIGSYFALWYILNIVYNSEYTFCCILICLLLLLLLLVRIHLHLEEDLCVKVFSGDMMST